MSDTKLLNNLAEKENSFNDEAEGSTALYYGELKNVLTDEQFKKLAKLSKYNKYFKNKDLEDVKKNICGLPIHYHNFNDTDYNFGVDMLKDISFDISFDTVVNCL